MNESTDWVEQRAKREEWIRVRAPELWSDLKAALERAVKSFDEYYGKMEWRAEAHDEHARQFTARVRHVDHDSPTRILRAAFDLKEGGVTVKRDASLEIVQRLAISMEGTEAFFCVNGERKSIEQASKLILEDFLFPAQKKGGRGLGTQI